MRLPDRAGTGDPVAMTSVGAIPAHGVRAPWSRLPERVLGGIEQVLGSPVVDARTQVGGFSPGVAARVRCADGSRAFVKAVGSEINPDSPGMYRAELDVARHLPPDGRTPRLLGGYDEDGWVALVFQDIPGRLPRTPWIAVELRQVLDALTAMSRAYTPAPVPDVAPIGERLREDLGCYRLLTQDPPDDLGEWERRNLERLANLSERTLPALAGDTLVHCDIRADNVLLGDDGRAYFVDWSWACRGAGWVDTVLTVMNVALHGADPEPLLAAHPLLAGVDPWDVTGLLAGMAGMFAVYSRKPAAPSMPTVREFQRVQSEVTVEWVRRRTGWA